MQNNDTNRRKKFYDQMSEAYDLGTFDEFNAKMDNAESREKLYKAIDADGKYDIGSFDHFDQAMKPKEVEQPQTNVATAQVQPTDTTTVQQAVIAPAAMPEKDFGFTADSPSPLQPEKQEPYKMPLMFKPEQPADNRQWAAAQVSAEQNMANPVGPNAASNTFQSMQQAGEAETARLQNRSQFDSKNFEQFYNEHVAPTFSQEKALSERKADEAVRDAQGSYMPGAGTGFAEGFRMAVAAEKNLDPEQVANNTIKRVQSDSSFGDYILGRMGINNAAPSDNDSPQLSEREQEWMNRLFAKETEEVANQITNRIYSQYQQENAPKSTLEYIAGKAFHENLASSLYKAMVRRAAGSSAIREQLRAMAYDEFGKDQSWMTRVAGGAAPFAVDMLSGGFALPNFVGQAAIKGGTKLAARELTKRMQARAAAKGLEGAALKEATSGAAGVAERYIATQAPIMNLALQTMGSAANFATYETQAEAVRQIAEGKFKPIDLIKEAVHGAMLGTAMGATGGIIGNLAKNASTLGKIGAGAAGIGAETGIFALDAGLQKAQADGVDIQDVDWADTAGEAFGTVIGMKGVGAVMHPRNFLNRYRKSKDYNLQLNQGDLNELKQAGYNLDDVFKGLGTFGDVTPMQGNTISKAKEITIGNYGKQHEVEDAWVDADNYEAIMRNPEISTSAKRKIAYIATGKILTPEPMFGVTMNVDENGKATVTTLNAKGDIIETKEYNNEQEAQDAYAELQQAARTNTIGGLERIADKSGHPEVVDVAKGRTKDETGIDVDNLEQIAELKDEDVNKVIDAYIKNLQDAYMERFNENLERLGEAAKSASLGTETSDIGTQSGTSGTQGSTSETEGETPMQRSDRREAAYQRGASVVDDESSLQSIGHDQRVAEARLMQQMPDGSNTEAIRKNIMQAVEANDLDAAEQLFDKAKPFLNNTQRDALEQYLDAASTQSGIDDAIVQQAAAYEEKTRQKLQSIADEQGNITQLQLRDGSTVYLVKGDLNNHYSAMIVTDGNGNNSQHLVSEVVEAGQTRSLDDILDEQVNNFAGGIQQMYSEYANYGMFRDGQQVNMILSGQSVSAVMSGYDPFGNAVFTMEDGSQIALRPEEAQQAVMEADNVSIQQQLIQEAESAKLAEQQERFGKSIKGYNEGQPDLTAAETDSKAAAEYLTMQANGDERVRKQQISDIENTKEQLTIRREEANRELNSINQWINGNEGIADAQEMEDAMQKRNELDATIKDIDQRLMKYGEIRRNLMTKEELASMEQQRRKEIFNARTGYQPQVPQRETRTNQDGITEEDGVPNFGLTSVGNANNYLLRNYPDSYDAEQFITNERLKLRNKQRDEVQPEMNKRNDILKAYADATIDLSPDEVKQLVHEVADLEAQQNVLAQQAVRLREIADGIQALYERNGRTEDLTPAELRAKELDKAGSKEDKLRIARTLYKDYPEALDRINDQDPRDLDEFIAANLGLGSMNWEGINQGERHLLGVQEAVFGKRGATRGIGKGYTTNAFNHYLAPTGEGKDFNTIVHGIYEALPDVGDAKQWTTEDISNALINMLLTAQKPSDISHRIIDNRIAEAEEIVQHEEEYEREMEEMAKLEEMQAWADAYHLTPEERDEFEEFMKMAPTELELDVINNLITNEQDSRSNELDNQPINNGVGTEIEGGRGEILGQGEEQIGSNQGEQRPVAGGEAGAADEAATGDNVSGGAHGTVGGKEEPGEEKGLNQQESKTKLSSIQGLENYSGAEIADLVKNHFNSLVGEDGIEIVDMSIIGSRVNGNANEDSDLDILLEYKGDIKEDSLFNILNDEEDRLYIEGIPVDINPIRKGDSGTIQEFMERNADYDTDRDKRNVTFAARLAKAIAETNTNPTEAQKEAGNYRKPKLKFGGYTFRIENPKGSIRSGVDRNGREWSQEMHDTYGYIEEKVGKDGDKMDFFINDDADLDTWDGRVYVVDQKNEDGTFDEHKVMYGYPNLRSAREAYKRNYEDGWYDKHVMKITGVRKAEFDKWLADSDHKIKPFSEYYRTKMLKDVVDDDFGQLISDVKERLQQIPEMDSQYTDEQVSKMDINTLSQLIMKSQADGSTSRYLLANTKLDPASEKADTLRRNIAQSEADIKKLSAALDDLKKEFKLRAENAEAGGAIIDHLQDMGIDVTADTTANRKVYKQAEKDNSQEGKLHHMRTPDGTVYGFTYKGKMYLDPRKMDANRPLHEYGHLWADAFRRLNPEGWKDVVSVMKQDADTWQFVKSINPDLQSDSDIAEEMIAKGSGEKGEERVRAEFERMAQRDPSYKGKWNNIWKNISKAIQDFWKQIGDFLGIKYKTPAQVYDQVLKDFANGVNPRKKVEEYLKQRDAEYAEAVKSGNTSRATQIFNEALKENVGNGMTPYVAVDKYRKMQSLAHKIKDGDAEGIRKAAQLMSELIPENAVLIPTPSHKGKATTMLQLAEAIAERTGSEVADILESSPRSSQYTAKKQGGKAIAAKDMGIKVNGQLPEGKVPVIIDNVVDTGNTAEACVQALGTGIVASLADSTEFGKRVATLRSAAPIIANKQGEIVPLSERFDLSRRETARPVADVTTLMDDVEQRNETARNEQQLQAAILSDKEAQEYDKRSSKMRQRATDAVLTALDDAKVPVRKVSRQEADQMMRLFTSMNIQAITDMARSMQPNSHRRYAVINVRDPFSVPKYFEKRSYANEFKIWANNSDRLYELIDLGRNDANQDAALRDAADIMPEIQTWHGSGAVFTKFDHSHMSEGAGSQAFGWGTYLSDSKRIGEDYASMVNKGWAYQGKYLNDIKPIHDGKNHKSEVVRDILSGMNHGYTLDEEKEKVIRFVESSIRDYEDEINNLSEADKEDLKDLREILDFVRAIKPQDFKKSPENLYKVEIPEDNGTNYLEYKKPVGEKLAKEIRNFLYNHVMDSADKGVYKNMNKDVIRQDIDRVIEPESNMPWLQRALDARGVTLEEFSKWLSQKGYVGIKYPAGTIYGGGDGATNYVIFNEDDAKIVEHIQFMVENPESAPVFYSNALKAVEAIKQEKATPDQWLAMIQKNGGLKAGEDKWIGLNEWLEEQKKSGKSVTKQEVMDYIRQNQIQIEETNYAEDTDRAKYALEQKYPGINDVFDIIVYPDGDTDITIRDKKKAIELFNKYNEDDQIDPDNYDKYDLGTVTEWVQDMHTMTPPSDSFKHVESTRRKYSTQKLDNYREIALTVPTIEPYSENDRIHFGDAGEGRAIAWIRFGDTETSDAKAREAFKQAEKALYNFLDRMEDKYGGNPDDPETYLDKLTPEEKAEHKKIVQAVRETEDAFNATKKKVLVIDEIQSKRHQDAREQGYKEWTEKNEEHLRAKRKEFNDILDELNRKYDMEMIGWDDLSANENEMDADDYQRAEDAYVALQWALKPHGVPQAPFEKNWHELAMKRMLRYAAENGYDKIAWTTGAQQAKRYDLSNDVLGIISKDNGESKRVVVAFKDNDNSLGMDVSKENGMITSGNYEGHNLGEVVGKEMAAKIMASEGTANFEGEDLSIGGEGMKGFYDEILPRFMNKYGKKWGVKVGEIDLPNLEPSAQKMWSIDVTPDMRNSVMLGQPMFQKSRGGRVYGWTDGTGIFLTPDGLNPNTPIHEYTHIWDAYVQKHDPELWKEMVSVFKQTDMWQQIRENPNYRAIWDDDNRMASEVHSRLSGQSGEQKFTEAAQDETKDSRGIINKVKNVLKKFWESIAKLFGYGKKATDRLAEFVNMPLRDLLTKKFNPIEGGATSAIPMSGETIEKTLMGVHNISEEKLKKALKLGGLANPSMAVIDTKNGIHTDYGEISLIPRSSLIDAKTGRNAGTYAGDAWTPTYPSVTKEMTRKGEKHKNQIAKEAAGENEELEQHLARTMERYVDDNENRLHLLYLLQKGIKPDLIPESTIHTHDEYEALRKILANDQLRYSSDGLTKEQNDAILDLMMKGVREKAEESSKLIKDEEKRQKAVETIVKMRKDSLVDPETGEIWFAKYDTYIYDVLRDEKRRQNPKIDWYKTDNEASYRVAKENLAEDYEAWKEQLFGDEDIAEKLFAGWTPDGNKKYVKNTVENASRLMNKEKDTNAYGNGGLSASKAMLVKKLKSLAEIRKYRHLIKKGDDIKEQLKQKESEWFDIIEQVSQMQKVDSNPFINNDIAEARLQEAMEQRDPIAYMNKEYGYHIDKDGELASQLMNFMEEASQIPVKYFETKFKRPVGIEEFDIAVVPTNTSPEVIKALEDKGLEVHTYEKGSHGDENDENRKAAVLNAVYGRNDILFHTDMAGESSVKSWRQTELFSDDDFLPEPKGKKSNRIKDMSDEELLKAIADKDGAERRTFIDIFDQRHIQEHEDAYNGYLDILNFSESSLEDAYQMYDNVWKEWKDGGYATSDRTRLLAQIDALEDFIQNKEEEQRELELERQEEEEAAQLQKEQEQFEKQKEEVRQTGYDLTQIRFRALEPGETCHVERRYTENKMFSFTGTDHIESIDDVAYIFRQLENKSVENTFVVLEKDGVPTIIHLAIGDFTSSQAPIMNVFAAYNELNPEHVWFVHNHPSGRIEASRQDKELMLSLRRVFGDKLLNGIIINTTSGKYGVFNEFAQIGNRERPTSAKNETPIKVYSFDQQVFDKDWNPETAFDSLTPTSIAKFISSHRLGEHKKMSLLVMDTAGHITGNIFLPWTNLKDAAKPANAMQIATYVTQMGGGRCVIYGNYDVKNESNENATAVRLRNMLKNHRVTLMDMIHMGANDTHYNSMHEKGVMEPESTSLFVGEPVTDYNEIARLEAEPKEIGYRNVVMNEDGSLGSPMANRLGKKGVARKATSMFEFDKWERSDEHPELATDGGKIDLIKPDGKTVDSVDYNPYIHIRPTLVNKQFKQAWERPNLVYVRTEYPKSELTSGYHADKAKLSVGRHPWNGGELILSRYDKPIEIVSWEEVADDWVKEFENTDGIHFDIIPPKLLPILVERGMNILPPHKGMGKACNEAYEAWKNGTLYRRTTPAIMDVNEKFNKELEKLSNKSILNLGNPSAKLIAASIENMPLRLRGTKLLAKMNKHNYKAEDIKDLPLAVHNPIFVFKGNTPDSFAIITEISIDNNNVLVAVKAGKDVDIDFNVVSSVYGKRDDSIHKWINENKLLYADKEKAIEYLYNPAPNAEIADSTALDSAAKIVNDFENPSISEENLRNIYAKEVRVAEETANLLGGEKIVFEAEANEDGALGWYDPKDGSIHVVLPAHADAEDVQRTVCHEKLGHEGLVALLGSQKEVDKFGHFVLRSANADLKKRIIAKADEIDPEWQDPLRYSHAAQEVIADIAADGPRTADEFSLWRKIKHYLIRFLNKLGLRIRGLLNDHDLSYYILKTGEALKKWNGMTDAQKREAAQQGYDAMYNRGKGKPRKRNNESMAQYLQRLREWERWKIAEQQARDNNDPMPTVDEVNAKWEEKYNNDLTEWKQRNNITGNMEAVGEFPKRKPNETPQEYAMRVADYETQKDIWREAPSLFDYLNQANREYRDAYRAWRERYGIREAENVDLGLYEGDPDSMPHIVDPEDLEAENRADAELAEAVGIDMSSEGAKRHTKLAVIERRKNLESANAEDAIWIHNLVKRLDEEAKRQGVSSKELRKNMADIIEGTYFEDVLRDENGNVVSIVDISDQLPIKMTDSLKEILSDIKDWYDYFYHQLEDAGLRGEAGYVEEGYVNHVWSREKSNPNAWEKYIENFQRTKSPNMRERIFQDYRTGEEVGLVRKFDDIAQIIAYYSSSNNQAIANKKFLDALSFVVVEETNSDGEVTQVLPLLNSQKPDAFTADRYDIYKVPGVGDVWVIKDIQRTFSNVFGTMRTKDVADWVSKFGRGYDIVSSTAKKIQLSFSAFHMGALTEVAMAQMRPDRAARALAQYIIFDCAKKGTIPAYAHPEDFKFAASHLVQLGATQDYSAADVNNLTEKFRDVVRELANDENLAKKGTGYAVTPVAAALDYINKGMDKVLWNYLHDGLKIACFKMFAEQIEKRVVKEALTTEQREQLLDEAGQYVNDTFGGQYWELLNVSPSTVKWLRRAFLSPDWLISTQRHFLANFGFGSLYSESGFLNYLRYNADNIKRVFGVDIPKDENRRFRSSNAKKCYILGVCGFFYVMMNALNAFFRAQDEEKEKAKADEMRKTNPDYKSGYELAYPDGMKWYDYTMYGNTVGQQTHLFLGRYDDGTEWYARWGKQFREFPELFMGRHGVEFPTPLMERMSGKANPVGRYLLYDLPLTVGMYGYRQPRETQEIADKYGNTVALLAMTAKKFLPFSVPTQEDKEFKLFDLVMPSQKGFTQWKAKDYFETYIEAGDMDGIQRTYNAAVMNGLDAEKALKGAIASVKATQRKELSDGVDDLQTAMERFDAAKDNDERKRMKRKILKYLADQNYKAFTRDEAREQVESFLNGDQPTENDNPKYLELQTSADVRNDYRISALKKKAKKYVDEIMEAEGDKQKALIRGYRHWFQVQSIIRESDKETNQLKKQLGKGKDDAAIMQQIRDIKSQTQKQVDAIVR